MEINQRHLNGAKQIILRCLGLQPGQNLLIFTDEISHALAATLSSAAFQVGVPATIIYIPADQQMLIPQKIDLSTLIQNAAREARGILTCVNSAPECLPFRDRILESQWNARTRIGHMPGAKHEILELANVDLDRLIGDCHRIELSMARGKELQFITYSEHNQKHVLKTQLGGWERIPIASNGVIDDGVWGNVPSGETFIAPIEGTAEGSLVINGSIPGMVVKNGNEFILEFQGGNLTKITPDNNPIVELLYRTQISVAKSRGDKNWSNLAEIGIGLNPGVHDLTGNMLFDEKCAGTAHIALGDNNFMGGKVIAAIHCDMVIKNPTIIIDGKPVLDSGVLVVQDSQWHDDHEKVDVFISPLQSVRRVCYSGTQVEIVNGCLQRVLHAETGRKSNYPVGNTETSKLAFELYSHLPSDGTWMDLEQLSNQLELEETIVRKVLHVMQDFELIRCD